MAKTKRISVPISSEIERELREIAAQNGCSIAAAFSRIVRDGMQKNEVKQELFEIRKVLKSESGGSAGTAEMRQLLEEIRAEVGRGIGRGGVILPEKAAALLYQEALFSAALAAEILNAELPGTPPKPAAMHIKNARQKSSAALQNFMAACRGEA